MYFIFVNYNKGLVIKYKTIINMLKNNADDNIIIIDKVTPKNKQENKKCPNISYIAKITINTEKTNIQTNYDNEPINNNKRIRHNSRHRKNKIYKN